MFAKKKIDFQLQVVSCFWTLMMNLTTPLIMHLSFGKVFGSLANICIKLCTFRPSNDWKNDNSEIWDTTEQLNDCYFFDIDVANPPKDIIIEFIGSGPPANLDEIRVRNIFEKIFQTIDYTSFTTLRCLFSCLTPNLKIKLGPQNKNQKVFSKSTRYFSNVLKKLVKIFSKVINLEQIFNNIGHNKYLKL